VARTEFIHLLLQSLVAAIAKGDAVPAWTYHYLALVRAGSFTLQEVG